MGGSTGGKVGGAGGVEVAGTCTWVAVGVALGVLAGRGVTVSGGFSDVGVGYIVGVAKGVYVAVGVFVGRGVGVMVGVLVIVGVNVRVGMGVRVTIMRVSPGSGVSCGLLLSSITTGPMVPSGVGVGLSTGPFGAVLISQAANGSATHRRLSTAKKVCRALPARATKGRKTGWFIQEKL